jgi:integrase
MARRSTGQVILPKGGRGWALRFRAYGKRRYVTLGGADDGWNRERAEAELRHVLADVERGIWRPHEPETVEAPAEVPTFHEFASQWLDARRGEIAPRTVKDYEWALTYHLLPAFARLRLSEIGPAEVDRYKAAKVREGVIAAAQINKTLKVLAMILDVAIEYELTDRANPARGRRRRVKVPKPKRTWVEPEQLMALLDAADTYHRPILATLAGAGLRVGEALALDWRDVNLPTGTLIVGQAKTDAGTFREVDLPGGLIEALGEWKAYRRSGAADPVFVTRTGRRQTVTNVDHRIKSAIKAANRKLDELGIELISERVTPHSLRRTYASVRAAAGDHPVYIAEQLGHEDPGFTFRVYQRAVKRRERLSGAYLVAFDQALHWAAMGSGAAREDLSPRDSTRREPRIPHEQAIIRHTGR